jgi:hypothetical protein
MTREPDHTTILTLIRLLLREDGISPFCQDTLKGEFSRQLADRERQRQKIAPPSLFPDAEKPA